MDDGGMNHLVNRYPATCFRCGTRVEAQDGVLTFGGPAHPKPDTHHSNNFPHVEHLTCHEKYKETLIHYRTNPDTSEEGFDDDLGLQTDYDP